MSNIEYSISNFEGRRLKFDIEYSILDIFRF